MSFDEESEHPYSPGPPTAFLYLEMTNESAHAYPYTQKTPRAFDRATRSHSRHADSICVALAASRGRVAPGYDNTQYVLILY